MSSNPNLGNFVYPIPICQPGADLGSILHIFHHSTCQILAIPLGAENWGTISSADLLSFLAGAWLGERTAVVGHPRNTSYQQYAPHLSISDFNSIIKPAIVFPAKANLDDFFNTIKYKSIFHNLDKYLVVDVDGELQGQLNLNQIIEYLASESKHSVIGNSPKSSFLDSLSYLLDSIPLPVKIETAAKKELYRNQSWQKIFPHQQDSLQVDRIDSQIASWWLKQQNDDSVENNRAKDDSELVLKLPSIFESIDPVTKVSSAKLSAAISCPLGITIERSSGWNYLRVPLAAKQLVDDKHEPYYLVFATEVSLTAEDEEIAVATPANLDEPNSQTGSTNNLLAAVSHELKSPLTGIVGLSSLLQEQKLGSLNQRQGRYVELIHRSGKKMMGIIDDLIKLASLAAEPDPAPELINLEFLCRHLGQQALTKIQSIDTENLNISTTVAQPKLDIELGTEMAFANKSALSLALNHLLWEIIRLCEPEDSLEIKIYSRQGQTAIEISCDLNERNPSLLVSNSPPSLDPGLNLVMAQHLTVFLRGSITTNHSANRCQFTLLLPPSHTCERQSAHYSAPISTATRPNSTILCLYPELAAINPYIDHRNDSNFNLKSWSDNNLQQVNLDGQHRIIEADSLEQAHNLARIWQIDVIILDGYQIIDPAAYLRSLQASEHLSALPLITLDTKTTEAANQIKGLNVYPCLLPAQHRNFEDLMQVIQIATKLEQR